MSSDRRSAAIAVAGFCVFLNLYAPQAVLPVLARDLGATVAEASRTIAASTLAVALVAPFTGAFADAVGRKRVILAAMFALVVPTGTVALAPTIEWLVFWRFVQGLMLPPVFTVAVAYVAEEWPAAEAIGITGIYTAASSVGGFVGRLLTGVLTDALGWRVALGSLALITLGLALAVMGLLTVERRFVPSRSFLSSARQMLQHLGNPALVATYGVGFGVLFTFIATFTYVSFHLAGPPFQLSASALGALFVVYLGGAIVAPMTGRAVVRFGRRPLILATLALWIGGLLLTLEPSLLAIVAGLGISASCGFLCQSVSTSFVALSAPKGASSAVGLYVTSYYAGGSLGAVLPGLLWDRAGWPGCVGMVIFMLVSMAAIVGRFWAASDRPKSQT